VDKNDESGLQARLKRMAFVKVWSSKALFARLSTADESFRTWRLCQEKSEGAHLVLMSQGVILRSSKCFDAVKVQLCKQPSLVGREK
jgi:hypothetical protein